MFSTTQRGTIQLDIYIQVAYMDKSVESVKNWPLWM